MTCQNCFSSATVNGAPATLVPGDAGVDPLFGPARDVTVEVAGEAAPALPLTQQDLVKLVIIAALVAIFSKVLS